MASLGVPQFAGEWQSGRSRSIISVCGDLHNLGDLALLLQNLDAARGRRVLVRQWSALPPKVMAQVRQAGGTLLNGRRLVACMREARRSDMVLGGGQIVRQNTSLRALLNLAVTATVVRWGGGEVWTRGLGVSQTSGVRALLWRSVLKQARCIEVRDRASRDRAKALCPGEAVRVTGDAAFLGNLAERAASSGPAGAIVIALCNDAGEGRGVNIPALVSLTQEACKMWPEAPVIGVVHDLRAGTDAAVLANVRRDLPQLRIMDGGGDLGRLLAIYKDAAIVLTNRLHSGIFASLFCRPLVVLDDGNDKLTPLYEELCAAAWDLKTEEGREERPGEILRQALAPSPAERQNRLAAVTAGARRHFADSETAIFNVKYSPNLGDGIIAECLEEGLRRADPSLRPKSVDLAGRRGFDARTGTGRRLLLGSIERLPSFVRRLAMPAFISAVVRFRLRRRWKEAVATCDSAVIGGGNLLADADQNFPIKVSNVLRICGDRGMPVAISHVGVTPHWSPPGRARFLNALTKVRLIDVSVRDQKSALHYRDEFAFTEPHVALDPGLLCHETYGSVPRSNEARRKRVGFCVTDPLVLRLHGGGEVDGELFNKWLRAVAERAVRQDLDLSIFTNGSPEDEAFANEFMRSLGGRVPVTRAPRFISPDALARFIGGLDCVVGHRLHACIAAYSYGVPAIGFSWDKKLESFFDLVERSDYVVDWRETGPAELVALIASALDNPPDPIKHKQILDQAREGIAALASRLTAAKLAA